MTDKLAVSLEGVPKTLLMPLVGRAQFSQKSFSPIHDERAIQLVNSLNYNFDELSQHLGSATLFWMARAYQFDIAINKYLQINPSGIIVNLGAGLETAFYRVDNQNLTWIDLDLPEVISLRKQLLGETGRVHLIAKSIIDYSWMDDVKKYGNQFFFFAGGLFMYFKEIEIKTLLLEMTRQFPHSELIFDSISKKGMYYANKMLKESHMEDAEIQWGIDDTTIIKGWSPQIEIVNQISYFEDIKVMKGFPFVLRLKMFLYDLANKSGITHIKFY